MIKKEKVLITGGAGFIGYHTAKKLLKEGYQVVGLDNINDYYDVGLKYGRLQELGIHKADAQQWGAVVNSEQNPDYTFIRRGIEDRENLPGLFKEQQFDAVINLAAQAGVRYSIENPETYIDTNVVGYLNILECCRHHKVKHLVYASSSSVYGQNDDVPFSEDDRIDTPISLYAASKKSNELMAYTYSHLYGLSTSGLRFFTVYGPWGRPDMALYLFADAIAKGEPIKVFNKGDMSRDFTYVDDIVQGIQITLEHPSSKRSLSGVEGENPTPNRSLSGVETSRDVTSKGWDAKNPNFQVFNIGNGSPESLMDFIKTIEKEMGTTATKDMLPMQPGDVPRTWADTSHLGALGYKSTTPISVGIKHFVEWFKAYYKL